MCSLDQFKHLKLDTYHSRLLESEHERWHRYYLPNSGRLPETVLNGISAVLDIGAGNGETCQFYLNHGAKRVICVEPQAEFLLENFGKDPRVTIISDFVGFIKSDCEGGERDMIVEGGHGIPMRWHSLEKESSSIYNRTWRFEEDWGSLHRKALRRIGKLLVD